MKWECAAAFHLYSKLTSEQCASVWSLKHQFNDLYCEYCGVIKIEWFTEYIKNEEEL